MRPAQVEARYPLHMVMKLRGGSATNEALLKIRHEGRGEEVLSVPTTETVASVLATMEQRLSRPNIVFSHDGVMLKEWLTLADCGAVAAADFRLTISPAVVASPSPAVAARASAPMASPFLVSPIGCDADSASAIESASTALAVVLERLPSRISSSILQFVAAMRAVSSALTAIASEVRSAVQALSRRRCKAFTSELEETDAAHAALLAASRVCSSTSLFRYTPEQLLGVVAEVGTTLRVACILPSSPSYIRLWDSADSVSPSLHTTLVHEGCVVASGPGLCAFTRASNTMCVSCVDSTSGDPCTSFQPQDVTVVITGGSETQLQLPCEVDVRPDDRGGFLVSYFGVPDTLQTASVSVSLCGIPAVGSPFTVPRSAWLGRRIRTITSPHCVSVVVSEERRLAAVLSTGERASQVVPSLTLSVHLYDWPEFARARELPLRCLDVQPCFSPDGILMVLPLPAGVESLSLVSLSDGRVLRRVYDVDCRIRSFGYANGVLVVCTGPPPASSVSVIDYSTGSVIRTLDAGLSPLHVSIHPTGTRVTVCRNSSDPPRDSSHCDVVELTLDGSIVSTLSGVPSCPRPASRYSTSGDLLLLQPLRVHVKLNGSSVFARSFSVDRCEIASLLSSQRFDTDSSNRLYVACKEGVILVYE